MSSTDTLLRDAAPRTRSAAIDVVRVVGVVAVVFGHVWAGGLTHPLLYSWHVPVFFVISGYLWRPSRPFGDELRRRTRSLLVPYVLWLVVVTVLWAGFTGAVEYMTLPDARSLFLGGAGIGGPYAAFWFVTALFASVIAMRALTMVRPWLPLVVGAAVVVVATFRPDLVASVPWSVGVGVAALVFLATGDALRRVRDRVRAPLAVGAILTAGGLGAMAFGLVRPVDLKAAEVGTPVWGIVIAAAISCGLILLAESVASRLPRWSANWATAVAGVAMPIILGHALIISAGRMVGAPSVAIFVLALAVPIALGLLLARTRWGRWLL